MRHTLLPLHERKLLRREYRIRITIVFCFILSLAILIGIASMFPTFTKALIMESDIRQEVETSGQKKDNEEAKMIQKDVSQSLALLDSLAKDNDRNISNMIETILNMRGKLRFTSFSASITSTTTFTMNIQGIAPTRNDLLDFKNNFESLMPGNKIDLPVSELAKNSNFQFSFQLKQKLQ